MRRWHRDPLINALAERAARGELESQRWDPAASVGRNAKRQDRADGLGPEDEHAVPHEDAADAQMTPLSNKGLR